MQCLEDVYKKIDDEDIEIFTHRLKSCDAVTIEVEKEYGIFIDKARLKNSSDEFMALAHEYGHCESGTTHKLDSEFQSIGQHENRANRAAVYEFLPVEKIKDAFKHKYFDYWEIADYLDMPEPFIIMAIEIYRVEEKI